MASITNVAEGKNTPEYKELKDDIAALRSDFSKLLSDAGNVARAQTDRTLGGAGDQIRTQKNKAESVVREHPLAAIGIAFGVGVLMAAMSRR